MLASSQVRVVTHHGCCFEAGDLPEVQTGVCLLSYSSQSYAHFSYCQKLIVNVNSYLDCQHCIVCMTLKKVTGVL